MFSRNAKFYEWLPAYLEDGLDPAQKGLMAARLAVDPALAAEAERLRPLIQALRESKTREATVPANSTVPGDLWLRLSDRLNPVPASRPARQYGWLAGVGATAALAVIVALRLPQSMPTETHPTAPVRQTAPSNQTRSGGVKIAETNPPPTIHPPTAHPPTATDALKNTVNGIGLPPHPLPSAKPMPPVTITKGNDPFAAPSAPANSSTQALSRSLPSPMRVPAPVSVAGVAPGQPRADRAQAVHASEADRFHVTGEGSVNGPPPAAPASSMANPAPTASTQGEAVATAPVPTHRDVPMNAYQMQAAPAAPKPQAPPARPQTRPRVFRKAPVLAMDQVRAASPSLETEQAALSAATLPPLWGETDGTNQANRALMTVRESGQLDTLRGKLEAARAQSPQSLGTGRMLAAVYEFGFQSELTVSERRRIVGLDGAGGEDWFALAVAEERAGNGQAAKAAYRRALELPGTLNSFHAGAARQRQ